MAICVGNMVVVPGAAGLLELIVPWSVLPMEPMHPWESKGGPTGIPKTWPVLLGD